MIYYNIGYDLPGASRAGHVLGVVRSAAIGRSRSPDRRPMARRLVGNRVMTAILTFRDVTVSYSRHPAVHHLTGVIRTGSLTAIVGPNGAGKTTLLKAILGLTPRCDGRIETTLRPRHIAYLPQQADIDRRFPLTVIDTVQLGHWASAGLFGGIGKVARGKAEDALAAVGLSGFAARSLSSLSAGQFQRVLFARVMLQDAPLILLDEPFAAIDAKTVVDLLSVIHRWHEERKTVVSVLHDFDQVRRHFPETLLLARQAVAWGATDDTLKPANLLRARAMAEAWDDAAPVCEWNAA